MEKNFSFFLFSLQKDILVSSVCFQNKAAIFPFAQIMTILHNATPGRHDKMPLPVRDYGVYRVCVCICRT